MTSRIEIYKEDIKIFDLENNFLRYENKYNFYKNLRKEFKKNKFVTNKVHTVRLFLFDGEGKLYLSRRSAVKNENSLLFDKTIGAHIRKNETPEYTVLRESEEELGFAAVALSPEEFKTTLNEFDLRLYGIAKVIDTIEDFDAHYRQSNGDIVIFPQITTVFVAVFDGPIKFQDSEVDIIELFGLEELKEELEKRPDKYTNDLKVLIPKYEDVLKNTVSLILESKVNRQ